MSDNQIEQFFIDIELNTKGVKKQADDILRTMDRFTNKVVRQSRKSSKAKDNELKRMGDYYRKIEKQGLAAQKKIDDAQQARQKKIDDLSTKSHVDKITQRNEQLALMKKFYQQEEALANKQARLDTRLERVRQTSYYQGLKASGKHDMAGYDKRLSGALASGDDKELAKVTGEMRRLNTEMKSFKRNVAGLSVVQNGVADSTRNMIRSYVSLFALFEGTAAIKRVGQNFQGMDASMLAAAGSAEAASEDMIYINGIVDKMGLSLKDTTDAWVKFKFAAKGKISQQQQEDIFTGLSMFGTSLKVGEEDMKRATKALIQIDCLAA